MKIYLDDRRAIPEGWAGARNSGEFKALIARATTEKINIEAIAFDHDLGEFDEAGAEITGHTLVKWLGENYPEYIINSEITSHSDDYDGRKNIEGYVKTCKEHPEELLTAREREYPFGEIEREQRKNK
ncbi:MAG: hypothetical protein UU22_C0008G0002 [Parcubacteria group bacterium GW2011_GWA2_40_8]|nr:MAG: hypothetical protein UT82_C0010G0025 [Parcubacteria group bacterium GW2011_GWB1_40_14]KKR78950.1 MAG: hypothetical protein UU22_C0008G0002 [Parcubacteria group bacterium GW2011_GWA2_40_8]